MKRLLSRWGAGMTLVLAFSAVLVPVVRGAEYRVDPARTSVVLEGTAANAKLLEQSAGSLTGSFTGVVQVANAGGNVTFGPGTQLIAVENRTFGPGIGGVQGSALASFGAKATIATPLGSGAATAASRGLVFSLASGPISLEGDSFNASGIVCTFLDGGNSRLDYRIQSLISLGETLVLAGLATNKVVGSKASLKTEGTVETLTLPIDATFIFEIIAPGDTVLHFKGQLVATRDTSTVDPLPVVEYTPPVVGGPLILRWSKSFELQKATALNPPNWQTVKVDPPLEVPLVGPGEFYRVVPRP